VRLIELLTTLRDPATIRLRCAAITRSVAEGRSSHFRIDRSRLDAVAERVAALTLQRFPDLKIPYHSRWRHFEAGGVDRKAELDALLAGRSGADVARAQIDLTVVSVLLDAGAGPAWKYHEGASDGGQDFTRSEGLGVASFRAFVAGTFASDMADPLRADGAALRRIDGAVLRNVFQASPSNAMVGLEGRAGLLSRLGDVLLAEAARSGAPASAARPGMLFDRLTVGGRSSVSAAEVLGAVLRLFAPAWRSGSTIQGQPAGDVWPHRFAGFDCREGRDESTPGWVPFHKLSQWLSYSLLEPLQWAGLKVTDLDALTGLPEYRNGGLLLDGGVIVARHAGDLAKHWKPVDEFIVEWRALTVTLLDEVAVRVRERLGRSADELPLACILEGGTWAAGRQIAAELREGGPPPLQIESDGTIF
jgi:hypothetical protein